MKEIKKKICFFSGDITRSGGTERVAVMIADHLAKSPEFEVSFLSIVEQREKMFFECASNIPRYVLSKSRKWKKPGPAYLPLIPRLRRFIKEQKTDVIIDIDTVLDILTVPAAAGLPVRLAAWEHFNYDYQWPSPIYRAFRKCTAHFTAGHADYIVTLTERDKENYKNRLGRKNRISVIYNPAEFKERDEHQRDREKILITVGRLTHVKGIDFLGKLAPEILNAHKDWKWYVLGEGEDRELLERVCREHHLQDRLIMTGNVRDVESCLCRASVYVMTSRAEGLPMCLLEAAGCGVPCVSFDIPTGPAEIIEDGKTGFLIPAFDLEKMKEKIEILIENEEIRKEFQANTGMCREKFSLERIALQWRALLKNL